MKIKLNSLLNYTFFFRLLTIDHCHLVIINTFPINVESQVNNHPAKNVSNYPMFIISNTLDLK